MVAAPDPGTTIAAFTFGATFLPFATAAAKSGLGLGLGLDHR
jgi:hypothetical protein